MPSSSSNTSKMSGELSQDFIPRSPRPENSKGSSDHTAITVPRRERKSTKKNESGIADGEKRKLRPLGSHRRPSTPLMHLHKLARSFPFQAFMVLVLLTDLAFLIYEFATKLTTFESLTLFTSLSFVLELMIFWGYEGTKAFFLYEKYWLYAEVVIINASFLVEYSEFVLHHHVAVTVLEGNLRYLRAIRFLRVLIMPKTRLRHFQSALRRLVSADRRRYVVGGYDLDLTYIYSNVIAMSWPSDGTESLYRNHIDNVAAFLDESHPDSYEVYNLCSERNYDESKFHDRVVRFRMDDHNPCELMMMLDFAQAFSQHIGRDPLHNVGVIHCKGGKGRTGTMVCAHLLYSSLQPDAEGALQHFGEARTSESASKFQGVESPSQDRYVRYFAKLLKMPNRRPERRWCRITSLKVKHVPLVYWDLAKLWYCVIQKPSTDRQMHYCSNPTVTFSPVLPDNPYGKTKKKSMGSSTHYLGRSQGDDPAVLAQSFAGSSPLSPTSGGDDDDFVMVGGCQPFSGNMAVYVNGSEEPMTVETFHERYKVTDPNNKNLRVDLEFNTSSITPVCDDVHIKFFHNVDNPNPLSAPLQIWFHTSFEGDEVKLIRKDLDGPHKDKKQKKWSHGSEVDIFLQTVDEPDAGSTSVSNTSVVLERRTKSVAPGGGNDESSNAPTIRVSSDNEDSTSSSVERTEEA